MPEPTMPLPLQLNNSNVMNKIDPKLQRIAEKNNGASTSETHEIAAIAKDEQVNVADNKILPIYFVDEEGNYYYHSDSSHQFITGDVLEHIHETFGDESTSSAVVKPDDYQTFTIVPSENVDSEVNYVLVVEQPDGSDRVSTIDNSLIAHDCDVDEVENFQVLPNTSKREVLPKKSDLHICSYCSYTTSKKYLLLRHLKSHSEDRPYKCPLCSRGFKTLASLQNHINTHTGTKPHKCRFCMSSFTTSGELVRHVRYRHTHEKPHKCSECEYASVELSKLKRHARCHTGERPYQCPDCTYASPDSFKLKRHIRIHTGEKPYECEICHMCFTQSNSLKAHKLRHNIDTKPVFKCELCPTTCGRKTDLRIHMEKLHTSNKPIKCRKCGKLFPDRYTFKLHYKTHDGEKFHKCEMCGYAFASLRHLTSHVLIHTNEKPFRCDKCDQAFRQMQLLKRHQNLYHNPGYVPPLPKEKNQECQECGKQFHHKGNLLRHLAVHDRDSFAESLTLKLGRQRKMQEMELRVDKEDYNDDDEEEEEEDNVIFVDSEEDIDMSPHYVVFEVIETNNEE